MASVQDVSRPSSLKKSGEILVEPLGGTPISRPPVKVARTGEEVGMDDGPGSTVGFPGVEGGVGVVCGAGSLEESFPQVPLFPGTGSAQVSPPPGFVSGGQLGPWVPGSAGSVSAGTDGLAFGPAGKGQGYTPTAAGTTAGALVEGAIIGTSEKVIPAVKDKIKENL